MAKSIDLFIDQGSDFRAILQVTDGTGAAVDLTGYAVMSQMRRTYYSHTAFDLNAAISDITHGKIILYLTKEQTKGIFPVRYVYDVIITDTNNIRTRVFEGLVTVNPGVSDRPATTLIDPAQDDDWGFI